MQRNDLPEKLRHFVPDNATLNPPANPRSGQIWLRATHREGINVPHTMFIFIRYNWEVCKLSDWDITNPVNHPPPKEVMSRPMLGTIAPALEANLDWVEQFGDAAHANHSLIGFGLILTPGRIFPDGLPRIEASLHLNVGPSKRYHIETQNFVGYAPHAVAELRDRAQSWCTERSINLVKLIASTFTS